MAGFKTHIGTSTVVGAAYAFYGNSQLQLPLPACLLAGGLCSVAGMLPDLDSDSGVPVREMVSFSAAVVPMLMMERFETMGIPRETMIVAAGAIYLGVRFGFGAILKRFTVHRGMFHSLPAAAIAGLAVFLMCQTKSLDKRIFVASAVVLGFLTHLILDEIWAVEWHFGRIRFKKSFGTALKFFGQQTGPNTAAYATLALLGYLAFQDVEALKDLPQNKNSHLPAAVAREKPGDIFR
ncbi:MAG: metal-dependent hydrolase [Planctomycetota bacterium]